MSNATKLSLFTTSAVRLVSGSVSEKVTKDRNNNNAPIPEDKQRYEFGVAMRKDDPDTIRIITEIHNHFAAQWANDAGKLNALNNYWQNGCDGISLKIKDGDKPNSKGNVNDNTAGCYVFYFSNWGGEPMNTVDPMNQNIPPSAIKRGFYVQVAFGAKDNGEAYNTNPRQNRCGAYLDADVVRLVAEGDVITGGIDAETAFGGTTAANVALPQGARPLGSNVGLPGVGTSATLPGVGAVTGNAAPDQTGQVAAATQIPGVAPNTAHQTTASVTDPAAHVTPHNGILGGPAATAQPTGIPGLPGT